MQSTTNVFLGGLTTDLHPLVTSNTQLTDALNATFITYNGNEMMLQNDMGNTLIQDSTTGAVMGLRDGFIPVGMKEHGGIMYIASYNPKTLESELGSIPSPVFDYTYNPNGSPSLNINKVLLESGLESIPSIRLSNERFSVGDVFYCDLDITEGNSTISRTYTNIEGVAKKSVTYPVISNGHSGKGLMSLHLMANCDLINKEVDLNVHLLNLDSGDPDSEGRWYHRWDTDQSSLEYKYSKWAGVGNPPNFVQKYQGDDDAVNITTKFADRLVIHYPNFQTGTLSVKPVIELPENIECTTNFESMRPEPYFVIKELHTLIIKCEDPNHIIYIDSKSTGCNEYSTVFSNTLKLNYSVRDKNTKQYVKLPKPTSIELPGNTCTSSRQIIIHLTASLGALYTYKMENGTMQLTEQPL